MPKPNFNRMPSGQQKAHVNMAVGQVLKSVNGNPSKLTKGHVQVVATQFGVPATEIINRMKARGILLNF